jgi:hypothetical protein
MARIEISAADIQRGLPPNCVYCGELTEDWRELLIERPVGIKRLSVPLCEEHTLWLNVLAWCLVPLGVIALVVGVMGAYWIDFQILGIAAIVGFVWMILGGLLQSFLPPRAIWASRYDTIFLHNVARQFCLALVERRNENLVADPEFDTSD